MSEQEQTLYDLAANWARKNGTRPDGIVHIVRPLRFQYPGCYVSDESEAAIVNLITADISAA